ncbi:hypothetical protein B0H17DRAFT_1050900 [Mycena rosella]|uniref:Uncharacterized protein n=1 Tax=Mycena rosella TaxID=1033263 RepID=A0AAD7GMV1_MYCRO|nr:hypothetical protein B0H17DRAFT_1050900 [Mycena rosella]
MRTVVCSFALPPVVTVDLETCATTPGATARSSTLFNFTVLVACKFLMASKTCSLVWLLPLNLLCLALVQFAATTRCTHSNTASLAISLSNAETPPALSPAKKRRSKSPLTNSVVDMMIRMMCVCEESKDGS